MVFVQYIIALAIVESIRQRPGYEDIPLRLKWPNDIYVETQADGLKKVGGLLVNSTFVDNQFVLVIGNVFSTRYRLLHLFSNTHTHIYILRIHRMWYKSIK